jgi:protein-disulfide isomerase
MAKKRRRKLSRAQARAEARRKKRQQRIVWSAAGAVAIALLAVLLLIVLGGREATFDGELTDIDPLRTDVETGLTEKGYPYRGSADAPVTVVEFSDYNCPSCASYALGSGHLVDDELVASGQIKYVVQPYALWSESLSIVEAAVCARDQDGFWDFHHRLFANQRYFSTQRPPSRSFLRAVAEASGLDVDAFDACLDQKRHKDEVFASTQDGQLNWGVSSTPSFFVNGVRVNFEGFSTFLDGLRAAVQSAQIAGPVEQE